MTSNPGSGSMTEQERDQSRRVRRWEVYGVRVGLISGLVIWGLLLASGMFYEGVHAVIFLLGGVPAYVLTSLVLGHAGGSLVSRWRPAWGNRGALIAVLLLPIATVAYFAPDFAHAATRKLAYLSLPPFKEGGLVRESNRTPQYLVSVQTDFTTGDALRIGDFLYAQEAEDRLTIDFYCTYRNPYKEPHSPDYLLYEYTKLGKDAAPMISTPLDPSQPDQGRSCR